MRAACSIAASETLAEPRLEFRLAAIADLKVDEISAWRKERLGDANVLYDNSAFSSLLRRSTELPHDLPLQNELRNWIERVQASYHYNRVALFDAAGNKWMMVPDPDESISSATIQQVRETLHSGKLTFGDFLRSGRDHKVYLRLFAPVFDGSSDGKPLGAVVMWIDPKSYLYPFIQRWPASSKTFETLLIRREGNEVVFLNELKFEKNTALALRIPLSKTGLPAVKAALGLDGIVAGVDYRGVPVLAAVHAVPDSPWFLVAKMDAAEVYAPMRKWLWLTVLFIGVLLFGLAAAVGFFWRWRHAALYRQMYETEHKYRTMVENIGAGISLVDPDFNIVTINSAQARILGRDAAELIGKKCYREFENRDAVCEHCPGVKAMANREPAELEMEAIRKDGFRFPVRLRAFPMFGSDGTSMGFIEWVEDITERKRAEEALRRERDFAEALVETAQTIVLVLDPDGHIVRFNPYMEEISGYRLDEVQGKDWFSTFLPPDEVVRIREVFWKAVGDIPSRGNINPIIIKDGSRREIEWHDKTLKDTAGNVVGLVSIGQDITVRRKVGGGPAGKRTLLSRAPRQRRRRHLRA